MPDFRAKMVTQAATELGWEVSPYDDINNQLVINKCWFVSFSNKQTIAFNIICLEYTDRQASIVEISAGLLNNANNEVKLFASNGLLIAAAEISTTSIMRDSFSMVEQLRLINAHAVASATAIAKVLR